MDLETLGYFLYMEQCDKEYEQEQRDKESAAALRKYQVESEQLLVAERATQTGNRERF